MYKSKSPLYLALRVACIYLLFAGLWIIFSDRLLDYFVSDHSLSLLLQTVKGWFFVLITGILLFVERKIVNESADKSEIKFRRFVDHSIEGVLLASGDGQVLVWNGVMEEITGIPADEACRKNIRDIEIFLFGDNTPLETKIMGKEPDGRLTKIRQISIGGTVKEIEETYFPVKSGKDVLIGGIFRDVTERKKMEESLKSSLNEKETLLKEIHHRVKNNLQMITSLLSIQERVISDERALEAFRESRNRVYSIGLIHENLYRQNNLSLINIDDYSKHMAAGLIGLYSNKDRSVSIQQEMDEDILFRIDTAIPFGLILNEVLTNSIKYAAVAGRVEIVISLKAEGDLYRLRVRDHGNGIPAGTDLSGKDTIGMNLIVNLSRQLGSTPAFHNDKGAVFDLSFRPVV
jgi:PAS domain S-box-containing protein